MLYRKERDGHSIQGGRTLHTGVTDTPYRGDGHSIQGGRTLYTEGGGRTCHTLGNQRSIFARILLRMILPEFYFEIRWNFTGVNGTKQE